MAASYVKLHTVVSDFAVGVQSVNQAIDNNTALYTLLDLNHSMGLRAGGPNDPFLQPGQHDDPLIARSVFSFSVDALSSTGLLTLLGGQMMSGSAVRLGTGSWQIFVSTPQFFYASATPRAASAADYVTNTRLVYDPSGPWIWVTTWNAAGGTRADIDFDLAVWAEGLV